MNKISRVGDGKWTLYLFECPDCGCRERILDEEKCKQTAAITGIGIVTSLVFGAACTGWFAVIGVYKLFSAGVLSGATASLIIRENYRLLIKLSERPFFKCPRCGCTKLLK